MSSSENCIVLGLQATLLLMVVLTYHLSANRFTLPNQCDDALLHYWLLLLTPFTSKNEIKVNGKVYRSPISTFVDIIDLEPSARLRNRHGYAPRSWRDLRFTFVGVPDCKTAEKAVAADIGCTEMA
jgi:hypothetical protein